VAKTSISDQIGLFISATRIEAAHLTGDFGDPVLDGYHSMDLPAGIVAEDGAVDDLVALSRVLKQFWSEAGFRTKKVVLVLDTRKALVRQARLPNIPMGNLHQAILSEAEQFAIFRKDEPLIDYFVTDPSENHISICYGALAKDVADAYSSALQRAGLKLVAIDLVQLAGLRAMDFFHRLEEKTWTSIMVLHQRLIVSFWHESKLKVIREVLLPERAALDLDLIAQSHLTDIVRSNAQDTGVWEDTPCIVIGCASLGDAYSLSDRASTLLNADAKVAGDTSWFVSDEQAPAEDEEDEDEEDEEDEGDAPPVSYVAIGAALWGRPGNITSFNLTGKRQNQSFAAPSVPTLSVPGLEHLAEQIKERAVPIAAVALVSVGLTSWQLWMKSAHDAEAKSLKRQLNAIQIQLNDEKAKLSTSPPAAEILRQWIPHQRENSFAVRFLSSLRDITPSDTWLTSVTYASGKQIDLTGSSMSQTSCLYFADQISRLEDIEQVRIVKLEKSGAVFSFEIQGGFRSGWPPPSETADLP